MNELAYLTASGSPQQMRRRLLQRLVDVLDADMAGFSQLVRGRDGSGLTTAGVIAVGPPAYQQACALSDGTRLADLDLDLADIPSVNTFDLCLAEETHALLRAAFWTPFDVTCGLRMVVARGSVILGQLGVFRTASRGCFTKVEIERANRLARMARMVLETAEAREPTGSLQDGAYVFDLGGELMFRSHDTQEDDDLLRAVSDEVRQFASGSGTADSVVGGHRLLLERLRGSEEVAVLAHVTEVTPAVLSDPLRLSPLKRRIASYAVRGATVPEIARTIERSPETVRAHIKQIYQRLGIASRVELAEAVRSLFL
ncbi:MAG: helix-turn-helix transcriptional regulator [Alphaproteobacteria bacterium]|nr:helix-turn-helix transcriptional regulator [Alphaproteobacteria bacterium]